MDSISLRCQSWRKSETEASVGTKEPVVMSLNSPWGFRVVLTNPELKPTLRMLPEVRATVTMRFHDDSMREIPFLCTPHLKIRCQNVINQAFATPWILLLSEQTAGVPGRGSRQCGTGFLFRSGQRAILKRAWHRH